MDFISIWKTSSIVLTGAFGVLGLLTEFKDKNRKITKWGRVSLLGIVITTFFGVAAQIKQSADDAHKARILAQKSEETLTSMDRALSPIDGSSVTIDFETECTSKELASLCKQVQIYERTHRFPWRLEDVLKKRSALHYSLAVFAKREDVEALRAPTGITPHMVIVNRVNDPVGPDISVDYSPFGDTLQTLTEDEHPQLIVNDGTARSIHDLPGKYLVIDGEIAGIPDTLRPMKFSLNSKIGEIVSCDRFEKIFVRSEYSQFFFCQLDLEKNESHGIHP